MRRLSIISHKGGAGKTSSAVMLAEELAGRGFRVVLVDADRQRGAGLLLGIEQPNGNVQQTRHPRLRYFCSSALPLRELPSRAEDLAGLFDLAVVDTPSLDDPLAKAWIQLSTDALMVLPVEPLSIRTLEGADSILEGLVKLNPGIKIVGTLPTLFDESDPNQRSLLVELMSVRPDGLLPHPIPHDPGMAHRAQQKAEHRTEASEATRRAYSHCADYLVEALDLNGPVAPRAVPVEPAGSRAAPRAVSPRAVSPRPVVAATRTAAPPPASPVATAAPAAALRPAPRSSSASVLRWTVLLVAALALLVFSLTLLMRPVKADRHSGTASLHGTPLPPGGGVLPRV
jgi:cellulose biosynthesis protein BcsQ